MVVVVVQSSRSSSSGSYSRSSGGGSSSSSSSGSSMLYQYDTIQHSSTHCTESPNLGHVHLYSSEHNCAYCCVKQMIIAVQCSELWNSPGQFLDSTDSSMRRSNLFLSNFFFYILFLAVYHSSIVMRRHDLTKKIDLPTYLH